MTLQQDMVNGIIFQESDLGNPVFTLDGNDYGCVPSVNEFKRTLESGGFVIDKMLTMVVRLLDSSYNDVFTTLPTPQKIVTYRSEQFRIESIKTHPTGAYMRIIAMGIARGI
jgi:hypothetical protein